MNGTSRTISLLFRLRNVATSTSKRCMHSRQSAGFQASSKIVRPAIVASVGLMGAYGVYTLFDKYKEQNQRLGLLPVTYAASSKYPDSQPSVFSPTKEHALYLWIHLGPAADAKKCAKVVADLQSHIDAVSPADLRDESNEIIGGVGFGSSFYSKIGSAKKDFTHKERKGPLGDMPNAGGDIFIHAKSDNVSKLFELAQRIIAQLPAGSVTRFEDVYSFVYRNGRDLSGFIDGTENPADEDDRRTVAVEPETGGSYVITQKWVHRMDYIARTKNLDGHVGRTIEDSIELKNKPATSHVARMTGGTALNQKKPFQIVRQSMPYGNLHDKAGLFFIAYAASPENFNYMLDRMVGLDKDGLPDDVMKLSECVSSTYWYFPGAAELRKLAGK